MCSKKLSMFLLVLLLASSLLWAFPGRVTSSQETVPFVTEAAATPAGEQKTLSGMISSEDWITQSQAPIEEQAIVNEIAADMGLSAEESAVLAENLSVVKEEIAAMRETSAAKEAVADELIKENAILAAKAEEAGSKAYIMLDGILSFENLLPQWGVGFTLGIRLGNSLMLEAGVDYQLNHSFDLSLDNWTFRAGVGWMF